MDLIFKNVKMPESCDECPVCDYEQANCLLADERNTLPHDGRRRDWCPVSALPQGHGCLIDADAYAKLLRERRDAQSRWRDKMLREGNREEADRAELLALTYNDALLVLGKMQIIVEAEEVQE